jgi:hypothetical protein
MGFLYALRYFQVVAVVPRLFIAAFVVVVAAAAARLTTAPWAVTDALTPVLLLQMFAASSGFQIPARRGHYDLLLTSGTPRWQIASAHCATSIAPGIAASHGTRVGFAAEGTCLAFLLVSIVAWATATPMTRGTAAVGWLLIATIPPLARVASPVQLLGMHPDGPFAGRLLFVLALAMIPTGVAVGRVVRGPVPLEASQ